MTWQQTLHEDSFTAKDFLFADSDLLISAESDLAPQTRA